MALMTEQQPQDRHAVVPLVAREIGISITDDIDGEAGIAERMDVPTKVRLTGKAVVADDRDTRLSGAFPHHDLMRDGICLGARRRAYSA
jgi:hypothetical protein